MANQLYRNNINSLTSTPTLMQPLHFKVNGILEKLAISYYESQLFPSQ